MNTEIAQSRSSGVANRIAQVVTCLWLAFAAFTALYSLGHNYKYRDANVSCIHDVAPPPSVYREWVTPGAHYGEWVTDTGHFSEGVRAVGRTTIYPLGLSCDYSYGGVQTSRTYIDTNGTLFIQTTFIVALFVILYWIIVGRKGKWQKKINVEIAQSRRSRVANRIFKLVTYLWLIFFVFTALYSLAYQYKYRDGDSSCLNDVVKPQAVFIAPDVFGQGVRAVGHTTTYPLALECVYLNEGVQIPHTFIDAYGTIFQQITFAVAGIVVSYWIIFWRKRAKAAEVEYAKTSPAIE